MNTSLYAAIHTHCQRFTTNQLHAELAADTLLDRFTRNGIDVARSVDSMSIPYVIRCCQNVVIDIQRASMPTIGSLAPDVAPYLFGTVDEVPAEYLSKCHTMDEKRVVYCFAQGMSAGATARAIGKSARTVGRIRNKLRERLSAFDPDRGTPLAPIVDRMRRRG